MSEYYFLFPSLKYIQILYHW